MNLEDRSAAYTRVCEQRTTENHGFIPREVEWRTRPSESHNIYPYQYTSIPADGTHYPQIN